MPDRDITGVFNSIVKGINDVAFAASLAKWRVKIINSVRDIANQTKTDQFEILNDLLIKLVEANNTYKLTLYRYNRRLYSLVQEDGELIKIKIVENRQKAVSPVWVMKSSISLVKKASLSSMVFREIHQFKCDYLTKHYSEKNGYKVIKKEAVEVSSVGSMPSVRKITKRIPIKNIEVLAIEGKDKDSPEIQIQDKRINYEVSLVCKDLVNKLIGILSEPAKLILSKLTENPSISNKQLKMDCGLNNRKLMIAKAEIARKADKISGGSFDSGCLCPVYFNAGEMS